MRLRRQKSGAAAEVWLRVVGRVVLVGAFLAGPRGAEGAGGQGAAADKSQRQDSETGRISNANVKSQGRGDLRMPLRAAGERYMWL